MTSNPENAKSKHKRSERQDWLIVLLILLFGFACVLVAGQQALRFTPSWKLDADMESNIDLDSEFMTGKPQEFFVPVDPAILTQPAWVKGNVFLTPGAADSLAFAQQTPFPTSGANTAVPTILATAAVATNTLVLTNTTVPTNTLVWIPVPATKTSKPNPGDTATNTSPPPPSNADLQITQSDGTTTYAAGTSLIYQVVVTNNGPGTVTDAVVTASLPAQANTWSWSCTPAVASCDNMSGSGPFNDTVNLPSGGSIIYTVTASISTGVNGNLINTVSITPPANPTDSNLANNSASDTNAPGIDLEVTKSDGVGNYSPNAMLRYTLTVRNNSSFDLSGVMVTDVFAAQIDSVSWSCSPAPICTSSGTSHINDTVNLPANAIITYTIDAHVSISAMGLLQNTASVTAPAGFTETNTGNNSATDSNTDPALALNIGLPDGTWNNLGSGGTLTMVIPAIVANGDVGTYDFVYYERYAPGPADHVDLDWVEIQISSDGSTWYPVFYWGNGTSDTNTNVALPVGGECPAEVDNCSIHGLYNGTGITIDIDAFVSPGSYPWIRITAPAGDSGNDGCDIDAIEILP